MCADFACFCAQARSFWKQKMSHSLVKSWQQQQQPRICLKKKGSRKESLQTFNIFKIHFFFAFAGNPPSLCRREREPTPPSWPPSPLCCTGAMSININLSRWHSIYWIYCTSSINTETHALIKKKKGFMNVRRLQKFSAQCCLPCLGWSNLLHKHDQNWIWNSQIARNVSVFCAACSILSCCALQSALIILQCCTGAINIEIAEYNMHRMYDAHCTRASRTQAFCATIVCTAISAPMRAFVA